MGNKIEIEFDKFNSDITWRGVYSKQGIKVGVWEIYWKYGEKNTKIAGGEYDQQGRKFGKWIEQCDRFRYGNQSISIGKYNKQGVRVGIWELQCKIDGKINKIGGGEYNEQGCKIGKWIEQSEEFQFVNQTTWTGEYNKQGVKTGQWDIYCNLKGNNNKVGGGQYNEYGFKIGKWVEQCDGFLIDNQSLQIGEYSGGVKVGTWEIFWRYDDKMNKIGGGEYEQGHKVGKWIEQGIRFENLNQSTWMGEYNNEGVKVGLWEIYYQYWDQQRSKIGGGEYDCQGCKIGKWVEQSEKFRYGNQSTWSGEYNQGIKQGTWDIYFRENGEDKLNVKIGGGDYDEKGQKIGKWIEQKDGFYYSDYINNKYIIMGEYQNGVKLGQWKESILK
ncbi:unnamed protein product [Paramecium sonneborni]|uniref:MORN repeat protein n=1 Tax=Paramecium sonneborni TaxID=65129 RepID=A0A8S1KUC2_9CILI|nr:unnamed protein product [Paramecium sonneborni]